MVLLLVYRIMIIVRSERQEKTDQSRRDDLEWIFQIKTISTRLTTSSVEEEVCLESHVASVLSTT